MKHPLLTLIIGIPLAATVCPTLAGTITNGQWVASGCGSKPEVPTLNLTSADEFNKSVGAINAYRQAIRPYLDCVVKEANADVQAISKSATAVQQAAKEANDKIQADVKAADEKFK